MKERKLESLLPEFIKAEPESKYSSDVVISLDKNTDEQMLLKKIKEYHISAKKLETGKYLLSPTDGQSNDLLRRYVWRYFENIAEKTR
jgi:hypothetical protein